MEEKLLTPKEVAKITGYCERYVRELIRKGKLKSFKPNGGRIFIKRSDLNNFIGGKEV